MATNLTPKVDQDTPLRDNKRIKLIQSEVEAAAAREAQDYYITRLTENYKQQLETMEQGHEAQTKALKAQLAASAEMREDEDTKKARIEAAELHTAVEEKLSKTEWALAESRKSCTAAGDRASKAEQELEESKRTIAERIAKLRELHDARLKKALLDKDRASRHWMEIRFTKKRVNAVAAPTFSSPKFAVRRCSSTFRELFVAAAKAEATKPWQFTYKGSEFTATDFGRTLTEVSGFPVKTQPCVEFANVCVVAWLQRWRRGHLRGPVRAFAVELVEDAEVSAATQAFRMTSVR
jgi:hypothetical protein